MLILASTTDKLRLFTTAAGAIDVHVSWLDNVAGAVQPGRTNTPSITTSTTTDIVGSPASGVFRNIKTVHVHNKGTTSNTVAVLHSDGATSVELHRATLAPKETLSYIDEVGFIHVPISGDDGATRVLLANITPPNSSEFNIGPEIVGNLNFDLFECQFLLKNVGAVDEAVIGRFSFDGGATFINAAGAYHIAAAIVQSGAPGGFTGTAASFFALHNGVGATMSAVGKLMVYPGGQPNMWLGTQPAPARVQANTVSWAATSGVSHIQYDGAGTLASPSGRINAMKILHLNGSSFGGLGYFRVYGLK